MKLSPQRRAELLAELALATQMNTKAWCRRYGIAPRTVKRLRAEAREALAQKARNGPINWRVLVLNSREPQPEHTE